MKMDEIILEIGTNVEKSLSKIKSLISRFDNLNSSSQNLTNTMKKVSDSISPTTDKLNNLSKTAEKTGNDISKSLNITPKMNYSDYSKQLESLKKQYNDLNRQIKIMEENPGISLKPMGTGMTVGEIAKNTYHPEDIPRMKEDLQSLQNEINETKKYMNTAFKSTPLPNLRPVKEDINKLNNDLNKTPINLKKISKNFQSLANASNKFKSVISDVTKKFSDFTKKATKNTSHLYNELKKLGLGLLSVRTAMSLLTKAVTAYLSFDGALQDSITNSWNVLGSLLAPAIEYIANLFAIATTYIYNFIKALTGVDLVARANAKALETQAKATKSAAQAQRSLTAMDEITNLQTESAGGTGTEIPQIEVPQIEVSDIFSRLIEAIKNGAWYDVGAIIAEGLNTAMNSINWSSVQSSAQSIGTNLATIFNGLFENLEWDKLGSTIGNGIQTAINFAYGFVTTFNFKDFGTGLGKAFQNMITSIDWAMLGQTINKSLIGTFNAISNFFKEVDWKEVGENIKEFFENLDWDEIVDAFKESFKNAFSGIDTLLTTIFGEDWATLIEGMAVSLGVLSVAMTVYSIAQNAALLPLIGISLVIGLIVAGIINLAKKFDDIKEVVSNFVDGFVLGFQLALDKVTEVITGIKDYFLDGFTSITQFGEDMMNGISDIFHSLASIIMSPFETTVRVIKKLLQGDLLGAVKEVGKGIANAIITPINFLISGLNAILTPIRKILQLLAKATGKNLSMDDIKIPKIPKLKTGTNEIESEGLYHLHEGEAVVPKKYNPATGGYNDGADNRQIIDLLVSLNANMLAFSEKQMTINIDGTEVARATYDPLQQVGKNKSASNVMTRS